MTDGGERTTGATTWRSSRSWCCGGNAIAVRSVSCQGRELDPSGRGDALRARGPDLAAIAFALSCRLPARSSPLRRRAMGLGFGRGSRSRTGVLQRVSAGLSLCPCDCAGAPMFGSRSFTRRKRPGGMGSSGPFAVAGMAVIFRAGAGRGRAARACALAGAARSRGDRASWSGRLPRGPGLDDLLLGVGGGDAVLAALRPSCRAEAGRRGSRGRSSRIPYFGRGLHRRTRTSCAAGRLSVVDQGAPTPIAAILLRRG